jgi:hypothetical protein
MVMRNRHGRPGDSGGWDDLPPAIQDRLRGVSRKPATDRRTLGERPQPPAHPPDPGWLGDVSRFLLLFLAVAVANLLFLIVCLAFLAGGPAVPLPGR